MTEYLNIALSTHKYDLISTFIRLWTGSKYSHCGLVVDDGVIESSAFDVPELGLKAGVRKVPLEWFMKQDRATIVQIPYPKPQEAKSIAHLLIGKEYDILMPWGVLIRKNIQNNNKIACTEVITVATELAGIPIIREDQAFRVSPHMFYMMSKN